MDLHQGVYTIDRIRTKHYLKHELQRILEDHQFSVQQIQPLRYRRDADTQYLDTWDWLLLAQRN